ncbi:glycosyltransferase family 2 protein [Acidobacteriota bacterium]
MPELSVILVSFNDRIHLEKCLQSLRVTLSDIDLEIVIVDNHSTDGSPDLVKTEFPEVKLLCSSENLGFSKANNWGIRASAGEFVLFLNNDTIVNIQAITALLDELKRNPSIGAVGPALLSDQKIYQVSFGKKVDFFSELIQKGFFNLYYSKKIKSDKKVRKVGWLSAACLMVRRKALEEAGCFDENYFLYFEDIDLCYRIRQGGWTLQFCPQAQIIHIGGTSTSVVRNSSRYHYRKSQIYFYKKHSSRLSQSLLRIYLGLNIIFSFPLIRRREGVVFGRKEFLRLLVKQDR